MQTKKVRHKNGRKPKYFKAYQYLKVFRRAIHGYSSAEIGEAINVHKATVNRWLLNENNQMGNTIKLGRMLHKYQQLCTQHIEWRQEESEKYITDSYFETVSLYTVPDETLPEEWYDLKSTIKRFTEDKTELLKLLKSELKNFEYAVDFGWNRLN